MRCVDGGPHYLEKTLGDIQRIMTEDMYQAAMEARQGLFQRLNPQVKVVGVAVLILSVQFTRSMPILLAIHGLVLVLALASGISLLAYALRTWVPVAFFSGIVLVPGLFSCITPGEPLVTIYQGMGVLSGSICFAIWTGDHQTGSKCSRFCDVALGCFIGSGGFIS